ncbi:MAG: TorF family putative porin [Gammaproteobacteria bacterium]
MRYPTAIAAALLCAAGAANAGEVTGTVTAVSDYDFRGVSLSAKDPALQASIDYAHDSGFYAGAWASNIDYDIIDGDIELDLYLGWAGETGGGVGWDAGIVWYTYPDSSSYTDPVLGDIPAIADYPEIYAGVSFGPVEIKQWYTDDYAGSNLDELYTEMNYGFELPADFGLNLHLGYNYGQIFSSNEYFDFAIGVAKTVGNFDLELKFTGTDLDEDDFGISSFPDVFNPEPRVVFSVSTTFPWGGEE